MDASTAVPMIQTITQINEYYKFIHYTQNDNKFYDITCQIILQSSISLDDHNYYDHVFFYYDLNPTAIYYITCKIFPYSSIVNILNKKMYGIVDTAMNNFEHLERKESLSQIQKVDLEQSLKQILPFYLTQHDIPSMASEEIRMNSDRNLNTSYGHNTQLISITDSQPNFDNDFRQQSRVRYSTNNVINPVFNNISQQIPEGLRYNNENNGNTNSFCGNIWNNKMTTQAVSISDSQNNGFPQPTNPFSQQQIDLNNTPRYIADREMGVNYYGNTNSFHGNIRNNTLETQSVLTTDINQNYNYDSQYVNEFGNFAYIQQQADLNNDDKDTSSHNGNIGDNIMATQANGLTCDQYDINYNHQVSHTNNYYGDTDSHNGNVGNNVIATQTN